MLFRSVSQSRYDDVQYHNVVAWSKLAELVGKLLTKGRKVYLEGRLTTRRFTDKNGQDRSITEIVMDDFIVFSDGKRVENNGSESESKTQEASQQAPVEDIPVPENNPTGDTVNPDDIPF